MNAKYYMDYVGCIYGVIKRKLDFIFQMKLKIIIFRLKIIKEYWHFFPLFRKILESTNMQLIFYCIKSLPSKQLEINVLNLLIYCYRLLR